MGIQNWTPGVKHANYGLTRDDHKFVGLWSNLTSSSRLCFGLQMASSLFSLLSCKESPQLQELHDKKSKDRRKIAILVSSRALYGSTALVAGDKIRGCRADFASTTDRWVRKSGNSKCRRAWLGYTVISNVEF